jgi:DNA-binding CsgD family transcriptional regulator
MPPKKLVTYTGLLTDIYYRSKDIGNKEVIQLMRQADAIPRMLLPFKGIIHVIDYTQRRHVALSGDSKGMMGFDARDVIENGLEFVISIFHKDDFKIYDQNIFGQAMDFLRQTPQEDHSQYLFTYSYRMKRADGKWVQIYQQGSYITDPKTKLPLYGIALVTDISPLKKGTSMIFSIDKKKDEESRFDHHNILTQHYYPDPGESRLSKREREILGRLADGLSSKQIADKLHLSENTIVNHRKNILRKTNTKNVAELIRYAINSGII